MSEAKKYTNVTALAAIVDGVNIQADSALLEKVKTMLAAEQKKANRSRAKDGKPTASVLKNRALMVNCARAILDAGNEPRTCDWIAEHAEGIFKATEASGKMNIGRKHGIVAYGVNEGKKRTYVVTELGENYLANTSQEFPPETATEDKE